MVSGIEFAAARENALACTKIDAFSIDLFELGMIVTLGKPEEETLHLDTSAIDEQDAEAART
jgi:hypothetical protein